MYLNRNKEQSILLLYLENYTKQYYLREISKLTKIPLKTTQSLVNYLEINKILKSTTKGKNKYFKLNLENIQTKLYLLQTEIFKTSLFLQKYPMFKTFIKDLKNDDLIVAFGSFAKFSSNKDSDVDLLIVSNKKNKLPFHLLPYKTHQIEISKISFLRAIEKKEILIKEIEENHVILNNHSFYVNNLWRHYAE